PPRRPKWPLSLIRTSYQVGKPWMLDGKILRELAGIPIRRIDLANSALALAEPDPLTLANLTTKSLTLVNFDDIRSELVKVSRLPRESGGPGSRDEVACHCWHQVSRERRRLSSGAACGSGHRHVDKELAHVPRPGRAALGAQAAMQADILVLD